MLKIAAVAAIVAATQTPPALAVEIPSCDAFRQRFESAPRILSLRQAANQPQSRTAAEQR